MVLNLIMSLKLVFFLFNLQWDNKEIRVQIKQLSQGCHSIKRQIMTLCWVYFSSYSDQHLLHPGEPALHGAAGSLDRKGYLETL